MNRQQAGHSALELMVGMVVTALIALAGTSAVSASSKRLALMAAISDLRADLAHVRGLAIAHDRNIAVRFRDDGDGWAWSVYEDGDGDGVRNDDIATGVDRLLRAPHHPLGPIVIGIPAVPIPDPSTGRPLGSRSPVRFNASSLCSFSRNGEATNGSVVLTDGNGAAVVEVQGSTARISVFWWSGGRWISTS
jgi:hypothetical protein